MTRVPTCRLMVATGFQDPQEGGAEAAMVNNEETRGGPLGAFCDTFTTPQQKRG
jgi:hypothetical protein